MPAARLMLRTALLAPFLALLAACADDTVGPEGPTPTSQITVNAADSWVYVDLDGTASVVAVTDPATSAAWDIAFFGTNVMLNGGSAGPGGVKGYCICQNAGATDAQVMAMTAASELADFEAVTAAQIPAADQFTSEALVPAIGSLVPTPPTTPFIISEGTTSRVLAKWRIASTTTNAGGQLQSLTFDYAVQPSPGAAFGPTQNVSIPLTGGPVYFDLTTGAITNASNWDLRFEGPTIRLNSGVSGTGTVRALPDNSKTYDEIDAAYAATAPPQAFRSDTYAGVFAAQRWYRYNITGTDNQIWPTFQVYLVAAGDDVFKVQLISYYDTAGTARQITMRYARLN